MCAGMHTHTQFLSPVLGLLIQIMWGGGLWLQFCDSDAHQHFASSPRPHDIETGPSCGLRCFPPSLLASLESFISPSPHFILWPLASPGCLRFPDRSMLFWPWVFADTVPFPWNTVVLFSWLIPTHASKPCSSSTFSRKPSLTPHSPSKDPSQMLSFPGDLFELHFPDL